MIERCSNVHTEEGIKRFMEIYDIMEEGYKSEYNVFAILMIREEDMAKSHPGFKAVQAKIEKSGYSKESAGAILANATRKASPAAKKANPALKKVKGK